MSFRIWKIVPNEGEFSLEIYKGIFYQGAIYIGSGNLSKSAKARYHTFPSYIKKELDIIRKVCKDA